MTLLQIMILALIQGAAELLPVSSSAHVILAEHFMGLRPSAPEMTFLLVMLHTGTMFAVLVYFWPRWKPRVFAAPAAGPEAPPKWQFLKMVVLATACTGILGGGLVVLIEKVILPHFLGRGKGEVEHLFDNLPLIGASLLVVGILIIGSSFRETLNETNVIRPGASLGIGLIQGLCLPFRGFSRSGATISMGLLCGVSRPLAEDFSFALAVVLTPPVIARELYRLLRDRNSVNSAALASLVGPGVLGMGLSFLAGLVALKVLSAALEKGRWKCFGYYCILAGLGIFAAALYLQGPPVD